MREGSALLQGLASCGHCGRRLHTYYSGRTSTPGYYCAGKDLVNGRGQFCLRISGVAIDRAVAHAFLDGITPAAVAATLLSIQELEANRDAALAQWRLTIERLRYEAERAERRYRCVDPENRLVTRGLEAEWEKRLRDLAAAEAELSRRQQQQPTSIGPEQLRKIQALGADLTQVWSATTTTDRDRKELLRTLLEEVTVDVRRAEGQAHLTLRWRAGAMTTLDIPVPRFRPMGPRTDEDTISLLRRLAALYPDDVIAGILNRQGRQTATGERFTANQVGSLRRYRNIPRFQPPAEPPAGELATIRKAAQILGGEYIHDSSLAERWLHRRRASHSRRTLADSNRRQVAGALCRAGAARVPADAGGQAETRGISPDCIAACEARRVGSRPGHPWTTERSADQSGRGAACAVCFRGGDPMKHANEWFGHVGGHCEPVCVFDRTGHTRAYGEDCSRRHGNWSAAKRSPKPQTAVCPRAAVMDSRHRKLNPPQPAATESGGILLQSVKRAGQTAIAIRYEWRKPFRTKTIDTQTGLLEHTS